MQTHIINKSQETITVDAAIIDTGEREQATIIIEAGVTANYTLIPRENHIHRHIIIRSGATLTGNSILAKSGNITLIAEAAGDEASATLNLLAIATNHTDISIEGVARVEHPYNQLFLRVDQTNILIGEHTKVRGVPKLEIAAHDIEGGHSCKIHRLGGDALFYLESHGLDTTGAETLLLNSEILKHLSTLPDDHREVFCSEIHHLLTTAKQDTWQTK